jgi:hypothetical protein
MPGGACEHLSRQTGVVEVLLILFENPCNNVVDVMIDGGKCVFNVCRILRPPGLPRRIDVCLKRWGIGLPLALLLGIGQIIIVVSSAES